MAMPRITFASIFVFVELVLDVESFRVDCLGGKVFQSLFSWNLLLMGVCKLLQDARGDVSILVFVELALDG